MDTDLTAFYVIALIAFFVFVKRNWGWLALVRKQLRYEREWNESMKYYPTGKIEYGTEN